MTGGISVGRYFGFEVRIDPSWFIIFFLVLWTLAQGWFPREYPDLGTAVYIGMGLVGSILFFVSVLLHEFSHSAVARARGMEVEGITLFIFGGMARTRSEAETPKDEFLMTVVGPLCSVALGLVFLGLARAGASAGLSVAVTGVADYLAFINLILAGFNLVPGFPLDGGRIFRSIVWYLTDDLRKATRWASLAGRGFGYLLIGLGLMGLFQGAFIGGIWFIFIGWFLAQAAEASYRQLMMRRLLEGVRVRDAMTEDPETVAPDLNLQELVDNYLLKRRYSAFPVQDAKGELLGLITLSQVKEVDRERWRTTRVEEVMTRRGENMIVTPEDSLTEALTKMESAGVGRALVAVDGQLRGMITRSDISQWLQNYQQLR